MAVVASNVWLRCTVWAAVAASWSSLAQSGPQSRPSCRDCGRGRALLPWGAEALRADGKRLLLGSAGVGIVVVRGWRGGSGGPRAVVVVERGGWSES